MRLRELLALDQQSPGPATPQLGRWPHDAPERHDAAVHAPRLAGLAMRRGGFRACRHTSPLLIRRLRIVRLRTALTYDLAQGCLPARWSPGRMVAIRHQIVKIEHTVFPRLVLTRTQHLALHVRRLP